MVMAMAIAEATATFAWEISPDGHDDNFDDDNEAIKDKVRTAAPIRTSVMRKLDFQVPASEAKYEINQFYSAQAVT